jgi:hypothetical protein
MFQKYKQLIIGILIGGATASTTVVFAGQEIVSAISAPWIKFQFDGQEKKVSGNDTVLLYKDRTYVPARFVAEELNAEVKWDDKTKTIFITKQPDSSEKPTDLEVPQIDYKQLPVSEIKNGVRVEVYAVSAEDERSKFFVRVKNTTPYPIKFDQEAAIFTADEKTYKASDLRADILYSKDQAWYRDVREDDTTEGFVAVPKIPTDVKQGVLHLKVIQNDATQAETKFDFNIKW